MNKRQAASYLLPWVLFTQTVYSVVVRDPTKPPVEKLSIISDGKSLSSKVAGSKKINLSGYKIQGIIISPSRRLVLINNKLLKVGDPIEKARVVKITPNKVTLLIEGETVIMDFIDRSHWNSWL